jgi:hypothetical protein
MATSPTGINWENLNYTMSYRILYNQYLSMASYLVLSVVVIFVAVLQKTKDSADNFPGFGVILSLVLTVTNFLFRKTYQVLTEKEIHISSTHHDVAITFKLILFFAASTIIVPLIVFPNSGEWFSGGNLIESVFTSVCMKALFTNFNFAYRQFQILPRLKIWWLKRKQPKGFIGLSQKEANELYEPPELDLREMYEFVISVMLFTAFYVSLIPIIAYIAMIGLLMRYFLFRLLIAGYYKSPAKYYDSQLAESMSVFFPIIFLVYIVPVT